MNSVNKRTNAQEILASGKSDDLKLFEVFKIYSEDLQKEFGQLYYALLGWKDNHLKDLLKEESLYNKSDTPTDKTVALYTDGACSGNPGPGGFGYAVVVNDVLLQKGSGGLISTTNNQMELGAVIEGLKAISKNCSVTVYTDSSYIVNAFEKHWIDGWKRRNWVKSDGSPVLNRGLWEQLLSVMAEHKEVNFVWVKGHAGNKYNELCDKLAVKAIKHLKK